MKERRILLRLMPFCSSSSITCCFLASPNVVFSELKAHKKAYVQHKKISFHKQHDDYSDKVCIRYVGFSKTYSRLVTYLQDTGGRNCNFSAGWWQYAPAASFAFSLPFFVRKVNLRHHFYESLNFTVLVYLGCTRICSHCHYTLCSFCCQYTIYIICFFTGFANISLTRKLKL